MTHVEPEDILRRALHAAAESVEPAAEGLTHIRARLSAPRPLAIAWLIGIWEIVSQFVMLRLEAVLDWLGSSLRTAPRTVDGLLYPVTERLRPVTERLRPVTERLQPLTDRLRPALAWLIAAVAWLGRMIRPAQAGSEERRPRYPWVRPAIAMAAVVLVAVVGGFALSGRLNQISQAASSVFSSGSQTANSGGGGTHNSGVTGNGTHLPPSPGPSGRSGATPSPTPSCRPTAKAKAHPTVSPTPTQAPTVAPTTTSPTTSPTTSSPSPTAPATTPPTTSGPDQGNSSDATQSAQDNAVVVIGARSGSDAAASPTPTPACTAGG
jgi:hypothetical protein